MRYGITLLISVLGGALGAALPAQASPAAERLPVLFEENRTQTSPEVRYLARGAGYVLFLTRNEAVVRIAGPEADTVLRMRFEGSTDNPRLEGGGAVAPVHYLDGQGPAPARTVPAFAQARYRNLWPGIDLVFHGFRDALEFDLELQPGAQPSRIRLAFSGMTRLRCDAGGDLVLDTAEGPVRWKKPVVYQQTRDGRHLVAGGYRLLERQGVGFAVAGYDAARPLVIDPVLALSSYHAGNGLDAVQAMTTDPQGALYLAGVTSADLGFPTGSGTIPRRARRPGNDAFVTKLGPDSRTIEWWTYYGGSGDESVEAVAVDGARRVYLAGVTTSADLPLSQAVQAAKAAGPDAFVAKFDPTGAQLLMASYLGGDGAESVGGLAADADQYIYLAGGTDSANFPVTPNAYQQARRGGSDGFLAVLDSTGAGLPPLVTTGLAPFAAMPTGRLLYGSYLGGDAADRIGGLALDNGTPNVGDGRRVPIVYLTGETSSTTGFPISPSAYQRLNRGGTDAFVTALRWNERKVAAQVLYSTYLGSPADDAGFAVAVQPGTGSAPQQRRGLAYLTGRTAGNGFPVFSLFANLDTPMPPAYRFVGDAGGDAFVSVLDTNASGEASLVYSIYLGGGSPDAGRRILVSPASGLAYVAGETGAAGGRPFPLTADAFQSVRRGAGDAFFTVVDPFSPVLPGLLYSTLFGGSGVDQARALAIDEKANAFFGGATTSRDLPLLNAPQPAVPETNAGAGFYARFRMGCTFTLANAAQTFASADAAAGSFQVLPSEAGCAWQASAAAPWLTVTQGAAPVTGPGSVSYQAQANAGPARTGGIAITGSTPFDLGAVHAVNQAGAPVGGCSYFSQASPAQFPAGGGGGTLAVSTSAGCVEGALAGAMANVPWISLGAANVTAATRTFTVAANAGGPREGVITIGGQALVITQAGGAPAGTLTGFRFVPVTPCRVMDSREGGLAPPFGTPYLNPLEPRTVPIPQGRCGIPASARAYSLNVTAVPLEPLAFLTISPTGQPRPFVSTLNAFDGQVVANSAIVAAGVGGGIDLFATNFTHVILDINGYFTDDPEQLVFYPVAPCRLADTRPDQDFSGVFGPPFLAGNSVRTLPVTAGRCGIPAGARAYALNVTVVPRGTLSYLTAWPAGIPQPLVSTLNSFEGRILANAAIVPAGVDGAINLFATNPTDVIVDINGYFAPDDGAGLGFVSLAPCRLADTRLGEGFLGTLGPPSLVPGFARTMQFATSRCSVPGNARAFAVNVTALPLAGRLDYLTIFPVGSAPPLVSTLNSFDGRVVANAALVPAGPNGDVNVFVPNPADVVIDINGYFGR